MSSEPESSTILVVDDNPVNLQLLFEYLGREGFRVLVCEDGESAVVQARETLPDIILMDVLLPGISGYDSCRAIHAQPETADIPIIFLTALSRTSDKIEGFTAGGVDYLIKPLQFEEVLARVTTHLSLRSMRQRLEQQNQELERRDRRREQLFGILAHDLRSPVAACVSAVRLLRGSPDEALRSEAEATLESRLSRLDRQLSDLLAWGELQISGGTTRRSWFDLAVVLQDVIDEFKGRLDEKGVTATVDSASSLAVYQDETAIRTILSNFVANAVKFTPSGGTIALRCADTDESVTVEVSDTGVGIPADRLSRLLDRGERVQTEGTGGEKGTGLGILLSLEIAELIDGSITAESESGTGTTFSLTFPSQPPPAES
jgi:signal transduction histidine kinase